MSADHDALIRTATQLMATRLAILNTLETLRREMEKHLDDSEARMVRTRQVLAASTALLQQSKRFRSHGLPARPMPQNPDST